MIYTSIFCITNMPNRRLGRIEKCSRLPAVIWFRIILTLIGHFIIQGNIEIPVSRIIKQEVNTIRSS